MGKRLKLGDSSDKPNAYVVKDEDRELYTEFEKGIVKGRYILEKKTKIQI